MESRVARAVIPAAGKGTRLWPLTKSQPKEMLPVGHKPTIQHVVEELLAAGVQHILLITGWQKRAIEDHFDRDHGGLRTSSSLPDGVGCLGLEDLNARLFYVRQEEQRGLGDAIRYAEGFVGGEPFVVALGDTLIHTPAGQPLLVERLMACHRERRGAMVIAVERVGPKDTRKYGIVQPAEPLEEAEGPFPIVDIVEKPAPEAAPSRWAVASRYILVPAVFEYLRRTPPGINNEIQLTDAIRAMLRDGYPVWCVPLRPGEKRHDIGNFETYAKAFIEMALRDEKFGKALRAHLRQLLEEEP